MPRTIDRALLESVLQTAASAPSAHNSQPWDCVMDGRSLLVSRSAQHTLQAGDPTTRQATIAVGMFVETLAVAAAAKGVEPRVRCVADGIHDLALAEVTFASDRACSRSRQIDWLSRAIPLRRTFRGDFNAGVIPPSSLVGGAIAMPREIVVTVLRDRVVRWRVAELIGEGARIALTLPEMRRELADFVHAGADERRDGMVFADLMAATPSTPDDVRAWVQEELDPLVEAHSVEERYAASPVLIGISSERDDPAAWFDAGRMRLLLGAAADGLVHDIAAGPIEVPTLVEPLRLQLAPDHRPQLLLRLGRPRHRVPVRYRVRRQVGLGTNRSVREERLTASTHLIG